MSDAVVPVQKQKQQQQQQQQLSQDERSPPSSPEAPLDRLSSLPPEVVTAILLELDDPSLAAAARVSRLFHSRVDDHYIWLRRIAVRFGHEAANAPLPPGVSHKDEYIALSTLKVPASKLGICHLNGVYWRLAEEVGGVTQEGRIAELQSVCWLAVEAELKSVPVGRYYPVWRLHVGQWGRFLDQIRFTASANRDAAHRASEADDRTQPADLSLQNVSHVKPALSSQGGHGWFDLICPPIEVTGENGAKFASVYFFAADISHWWKSGLGIAHITLRRVPEEERDNRAAGSSSIFQNVQQLMAGVGSRIMQTFAGQPS